DPAAAIDQVVRDVRDKIQQAPRELRASDEKTVEEDYRAAGRELNRAPFEALVDNDDKYLVETYRIAYLLTGRDLLRPRLKPASAAGPPTARGQPAVSGRAPKMTKPGTAPARGRGTVIFAGPD